MKTPRETKKFRLKTVFTVIAFAAVMLLLVLNINEFFAFLNWLWEIMKPLVMGGCIAFVLNILMVWFDKKVFGKIQRKTLRNVLSLLASLLVFVAIVVVILAIAIPQLIDSFNLLSESLPIVYGNVVKFVDRLPVDYPYLKQMLDNFSANSENLSSNIANYLRSSFSTTLSQTFAAASYTLGAATTFLIGLMFSFYILLSKEKLGRQIRQLCYTYLPNKKANKLLYIFHLTYDNFTAFIQSQCVEAVILFFMYLVVATIFRIPYSLMIATIIGIFSLIPVFGAWIGWAIGVFLIVTVKPFDAITFSVLFLIISQIEANLIYPRIVGSSIGLPGIWVLASVTVGGNMLGIVGLIIAVPLAALCYTLLSESSQKILRGKEEDVTDIIHSPNWAYFNPETDLFEEEPVHLTNVFDEKQIQKKAKHNPT